MSDIPDDVIEAVSRELYPSQWDVLPEHVRAGWRARARAALSVPAVAAVFARDAKVAEIVGRGWPTGTNLTDWYADQFVAVIAALDPEAES